jgi:hypothetical protein
MYFACGVIYILGGEAGRGEEKENVRGSRDPKTQKPWKDFFIRPFLCMRKAKLFARIKRQRSTKNSQRDKAKGFQIAPPSIESGLSRARHPS